MCLGALQSFRASDSFHFVRGQVIAPRQLWPSLFLLPSSASSLLKFRVCVMQLRCVVICFALVRSVPPGFRSPSLLRSPLAREFAKSFLDHATCKSDSRHSLSLSPYSFPNSISHLSLFLYVVAERRHDLRGGEDGLRARRLEGRREEVLLQQPGCRARRRPGRPPLLFTVLQQSAGDEEQVSGPPAGARTGATGIRQADDESEF